jgi:branched-chain amino acid transport system substrate-binding protein
MPMKATIPSAILAAATLVLCGCASGSVSATISATPSKASDFSASAAYLGAKTGAAGSAASPITLGWINEQGGAISSPEATAGAEAAVSLINNRLDGIDGHPLKLLTCFVASSEEEGQTCAQQMYNDAAVIGVLTGATSLSSPALHSVLAGKKPVIGSTPSSPTDTAASWSYYIGNGVFGAPSSMGAYAIKDLGVKKLALIGPAFIGTTVAINAVSAEAKAAGVQLTIGTYPQGSSDVTPAIVAAKVAGAGAVLALDNTSTGCIAIAKALTELAVTTKVVSLNTCAQDSVKTALGDLPKWTYLSPTKVPAAGAPDPSGQVADYLAAMHAYQPGSTVQSSAPGAYALVMYVARLLNSIGFGKTTPAALNAALATSTGPVFMGSPTLKFGTKPFTAIGTLANLFYSYQGNGAWQPEADGAYVK